MDQASSRMDNRRDEDRIEHNIRFFVHVHACKDDPDMVGVSVACQAIDFSTRGVQFISEAKLAPQTLLNITIGVGNPFSMFLLRGEVRWVREGREIHMGILLRDAPGTDLVRWGSEFSTIFGDGLNW